MITAIAVPMLGEQVGWRRWTAIAIGFGGVVIMLRPTPSAIQWLGFLPLAAAFCSSMRDIYARRLAGSETANSMMFWSALATIFLALFSLLWMEVAKPRRLGIARHGRSIHRRRALSHD